MRYIFFLGADATISKLLDANPRDPFPGRKKNVYKGTHTWQKFNWPSQNREICEGNPGIVKFLEVVLNPKAHRKRKCPETPDIVFPLSSTFSRPKIS